MSEIIGAKAAIHLGPYLLLTLRDDRPDIPCPNMWDLPGGGCEPQETPWQTVLRETMEEVSLDLTGIPPVWERRFPSAHHAGEFTMFYVLHLPLSRMQDIRMGQEGQGWRLVMPAHYRQMPAAVPYLRERFFLWADGASLT